MMREIANTFNPIRKSGTKTTRRRFILFFEGFRTEIQYFSGMKDNRQHFRIPSLIEICVMCRYPMDAGSSDPMRLLELVDEYMMWLKHGKYAPNLFMNTYLCKELSDDYVLTHNKEIDDFIKHVEKDMSHLVDSEGLVSDVDGALAVCNVFLKEIFRKNPITEVMPARPDYDENRDVVCVIIDRDADNRPSSKCSDFLSRCKEKNYMPVMTNPCFEFWLLLHFEKVLLLDRKKIKSNECEGGKRYVELKLDEILREYDPLHGYDKTNLDCGRFVHRINEAIKNEKHFCNDIRCIKNEIGSNVGHLIALMRER